MSTILTNLAQNPELTPKKLSLISPMLSAKTHIDVFASIAGLTSDLKHRLAKNFEKTASLELENTFLPPLMSQIKADGMVCHDLDDSYIPHAYGEAIVAAWQDAVLYSSQKLGHRRIVRDGVVIDKIVQHMVATRVLNKAKEKLMETEY